MTVLPIIRSLSRRYVVSFAVALSTGVLVTGCADVTPQDSESIVGANQQAATDAADGLSITMSMSAAQYKGADVPLLRFTVTNTSAVPKQVLSWKTPLNGVEDDIFRVSKDGAEVAYRGRLYKRPAPSAQDYIVLAPGESKSATVNLADSYSVHQAGQHSVRYVGLDTQASAKVSAVTFTLLNDQELPAMVSPKTACSAAQNAILAPARAGAQEISSDALDALNVAATSAAAGLLYGAPTRYLSWFGTYDSGRYGTLTSHYANLVSALGNVTFDCSCTSGDYAYVYANQPYVVYPCNLFWSAPMFGTDSKAGTLVHETSHFTVVAGTSDVVYGQTSARTLAQSKPAQAITNADSHEYFAENFPRESMNALFDTTRTGFIVNNLSGRCLDVAGAPGSANGANVQHYDCETGGGTTDQVWTITAEGFIKNNYSNRCLDVAGAPGTTNATNVQIYDCETSTGAGGSATDQRWEITKAGFIRNTLSGRCLDVAGAPGTRNTANIELYDCETTSTTTDQKWHFYSPRSGFIRNLLSNRCIDVAGAPGTANTSNIQLYDCEASVSNTDQKWELTPQGFIRNLLSGRCIDVAGAPGTANTTNIQLYDCETSSTTTDQKWDITVGGFIVNVLSGKCIDVAGGPGTAATTNIQLFDCESAGFSAWGGTTDQHWMFQTQLVDPW